MEQNESSRAASADDAAMTALREAFARLCERLMPELEPAPVYFLHPPGSLCPPDRDPDAE